MCTKHCHCHDVAYCLTTAEVDELRSANQKLRSREQSFLTEKGLQAHKISELDEQLVQLKQVTLILYIDNISTTTFLLASAVENAY
jgi:tRNA(Met) C34 N-acetyltransferase TmcA